jgi:hypothetical protein
MWRMLAVLTACVGGLVACGPGERVEPIDLRGCPSGKDIVRATDVIGQPPPKGYDVVAGNRKRLKQIADQFKSTIGDSWRGYDAKVLVRHRKVNGAAVIVLNSDDKTTGNDELVRGADRGAKETGQTAARIDIAGQEGRMVQAPDGAYIAMAPTGRCAVVLLIADTAALVRDAASVIPAGR